MRRMYIMKKKTHLQPPAYLADPCSPEKLFGFIFRLLHSITFLGDTRRSGSYVVEQGMPHMLEVSVDAYVHVAVYPFF